MKYIDADRLKAEIEKPKNELKVGNYYLDNSEQAVGYENALIDFELLIASLQQEQPSLPDNLELNMRRTKLELNEIETLTHLVREKAVEPGNFQGLYKGILSKLNKMFDEEYAERERKEERQ